MDLNKIHEVTNQTDFPSGITVDNYGHTKYSRSKSKGSSRKVSCLDDKYIEEDVGEINQQSDHNHYNSHTDGVIIGSDGGERDHERTQVKNRDRDMSKRVDFCDRDMDTVTKLSSGHSRPLSPTLYSHSTLTDSRAIREIDIRFLNDNLSSDMSQNSDLRMKRPVHSLVDEAQFTHFDVNVPTSARTDLSSTKHAATTFSNDGRRTLSWQEAGNVSFNDAAWRGETISTGSSDAADTGIPRRFRKTLKDLNQGGLEKLKEKIRKQQMKASPRELRENASEAAMGATGGKSHDSTMQQLLHDDGDIIAMQAFDPGTGEEKHPCVRKIASGPPLPIYKGFSDPEIKYKYLDGRSATDGKRREKKKKESLKLQEKKQDPEIQDRESDLRAGNKSKKPNRVVAVLKDKQITKEQPKKTDIITTSSWRQGQELILRELGPLRQKRSSQSRKAKTTQSGTESEDDKHASIPEPMVTVGVRQEGDRDSNHDVEKLTAIDVELERAQVLSEEARRVLTDLHVEESDQGRDYKISGTKMATKRKAPKYSEPEKQQPVAKHRHYDQDEVRKYIIKQKAERQQRQKDEERKFKEADEKRRIQLEELKVKQKKSARSKSQNRADDNQRPVFLQDLPRHHSFHEDRSRKLLVGGKSDKENRRSRRDEMDHDHSDGSSTITADESLEDLTPSATPRDDKVQDSKLDTQRSGHSNTYSTQGEKQQKLKDLTGNKKQISLGGLTFDMDGVVSKFGQVVYNRTANDHDRKPLSTNSGYGESVSSEDNHPICLRMDRIQNLKNQAALLTNRIEAEKMKMNNLPRSMSENAAAYSLQSQGQWTHPRLGHSDRDTDDFVSKYDRITVAREDNSVFTSDLPGSSNRDDASRVVGKNQEQRAATQIQAAYRGHAVRQSLNRKLPFGQTLAHHIKNIPKNKEDIGEDSTLTETSTFSDITITEDSDNDSIPCQNRKIGTGLRQRDFHVLGHKNTSSKSSSILPASSRTSKYTWEDPKPDPNSVFNILTRKYKHQDRVKSHMEMGSTDSLHTESLVSVSGDLVSTLSASHQVSIAPKPPHRGRRSKLEDNSEVSRSGHGSSTIQTSKSLGISSRADSDRKSSAERTKGVSVKSQSAISSLQHTKSRGNEDNTLDNDSYTQSFESEDQLGRESSRSVSDRAIVQSYSKATASQVADTDTSSIEDTQLSRTTEHGVPLKRLSPKVEESMAKREAPRYSPNALGHRFYAELNQLETMEESMRQLTGVERTRAISMAQQETVSLAEILKSHQLSHGHQLQSLQLKAKQEMLESNRQLEEIRKQASTAAQNAAETISQLRTRSRGPSQETARKLIETQTEAARATAEATRFLAEARGISLPPVPETAKVSSAEAAGADNLRRSHKSKKMTSQDGTTSLSKAISGHTLDTIRNEESDVSIHSIGGALGQDLSHGSGDDYSLKFDETLSEDEIEERSFRSILPSESHRKKSKNLSDMSVTSDEGGLDPKFSVENMNTLFIGEDSFNKFTEEMVRQFRKEEKIRLQHQTALLRLREKALTEKTKAELEWLEMQKHQLRNKGADDIYPQIVKKQRGLKMKLQEQKAKIRKLRESNEAVSRQRQTMLQHQEVTRNRLSTGKDSDQRTDLGGRIRQPLEVHTEDEINAVGEVSDSGDTMMRKDYKSDSEIYTEPASARSSRAEAKVIEKLKKINFDEKFLTARELKLSERKKNVEELLKWKTQLDEEEMKIYHMERKAMEIWDTHDGDKKKKDKTKSKDEAEPDITSKRDLKESQTELATARDADSLVTETVKTAQDISLYASSIQDKPPLASGSGSESSPDEVCRGIPSKSKHHLRSGSDSSIPEEIQSQSSVEEVTLSGSMGDKKPTDSSNDTIVNDYGQDTFEASTTATSKKSRKSPPSPLPKISQRMLLAGRELSTSPRTMFRARGSESESEDSISHPETQSDQSDFEGRIRALSDELRRRKIEADKLKRERKRRKREMMKNKEESLRKQIEAYDNQISQLKADLQEQMEHDPIKVTVKPQIKQPKVSPTKNIKKQDVTPPKRTNSEGNRLSSFSYEESRDSLESVRSLPCPQEEKDLKQPLPVSKGPPSGKGLLEKISEGSKSMSQSEKLDKIGSKTVSLPRESVLQEDDISMQGDRTEIIEEIFEVLENELSHSESASGYSGLIQISKQVVPMQEKHSDQTEQLEDSSYSLDFTDDQSTPQTSKTELASLSAQSKYSEFFYCDQPLSAGSIPEQTSEGAISEYIRGVLSPLSEDFIKPIDLRQGRDIDDQESDGDVRSPRSNSYVTTRSDSRPSSGKSEPSLSSQFSVEYEDSSESERTPFTRLSAQSSTEKFPSKQNYTSKDNVQDSTIRSNLMDIDDLIGRISDETDEETPIASPKESQGFDFHDEDDFVMPAQKDIDPLANFNIGDRVYAIGPRSSKKYGTLLFRGKVKFAPGIWAGIQLDEAEGTNDGQYLGERYFKCPPSHGILIPCNDLIKLPKDPDISGLHASGRSSQDSALSEEFKETEIDIVESEPDLRSLIDQADHNVQKFIDSSTVSPHSKSRNKQELADHITDQLFSSVLKENVETISSIAARQPPALETLHDKNQFVKTSTDNTTPTDRVVNNLLDEAIDHMVKVEHYQQLQSESVESRLVNGHISDDSGHKSLSPNELQMVRSQEDEDLSEMQCPESPVPVDKNSSEALDVDMNGLTDSEEYFEEEPWNSVSNKAPPPYPGDLREIAESELKRLLEETFYAVPHNKDEIVEIVSMAVDVYWKCRRYGKSLETVQPPESFLNGKDVHQDLESKSHQVFKKLLFELTGDIFHDVYKDEDSEQPPQWTKPKRKQHKYFRGISLPTTIDVVKPIVQEAVIDILGLNGSRKADCNKWNIRKKKDHVDNILIRELKEEEPQWVNYDDDELAVKMQLTDDIFDSLLIDTVQTMNKIIRNKQCLQQK